MVILLLWGLLLPATAFSQFSLQAIIRPRGEIRYGYKTLAADSSVAAKFVSQRTRLILHYQQSEYEMGVSFQDVRTWGDASIYSATGAKADPATIDMHEAWFAYSPGEKTAIKVGRQEWVYDDQRLLSNRLWNNHGMSYDGVLIKYQVDQVDIHLAGSWNNDREDLLGDSFTSQKLKTLNFVYLKKPFVPWLEASFLGVFSGFKESQSGTRVNYRSTFGPFIQGKNEDSFWEGSFYYQTGHNRTGQKVDALLAHADLGYWFIRRANALVGFDYLTGNKATAKKDHSFYLLSGARHRFFGYMDQFSNVRKSTNDAGLQDYYLKVNWLLRKHSNLYLHYHRFFTEKKMAGYDRYLGDELDLVWKHAIRELPIKLRVGLSLLWPGKTLKHIKGVSIHESETAWFGYLMVTFSPKLVRSN